MNKKVFEKKLEALKEYGAKGSYDFRVSKEGNYYIIRGESTITREYGLHSITKATLNKIGTSFQYPSDKHVEIIMLTASGKFIRKVSGTWSNLKSWQCAELYYIGKKSEWVLAESHLFKECRLCLQFSSLNKFKNYLGFDFISDDEFRKIFNKNPNLLLQISIRTKDEKVNYLKLSENVYLSDVEDALNMERDLDKKFILPAGKNAFIEIHDSLALEVQLLRTKNYDVQVTLDNFDIPYAYKIITNTHELVRIGKEQKHCLGSYTSYLKHDLFLLIEDYACHIKKCYPKWEVSQMRRFANESAPKEMINEVNKALLNANIKIEFLDFDESSQELTYQEDDVPF